MNQLAVSPCSNPELDMDQVLQAYSEMGFTKFELFTGWAKSSVDITEDVTTYLEKARKYGMDFLSIHLPAISKDDPTTFEKAVATCEFAQKLGVQIVLYKAKSIDEYISFAPAFLDAIEHLDVIPVIQNHAGSAISSFEDVRNVLLGVADNRLKALLEVGQFHSVGVNWKEAADFLGDKIALIHIKDQIGSQSVPFGTGEVDLVGLVQYMKNVGYKGNYVIEMEVADKENTLIYLKDALKYMEELL